MASYVALPEAERRNQDEELPAERGFKIKVPQSSGCRHCELVGDRIRVYERQQRVVVDVRAEDRKHALQSEHQNELYWSNPQFERRVTTHYHEHRLTPTDDNRISGPDL
jgi:hypothetical protein